MLVIVIVIVIVNVIVNECKKVSKKLIGVVSAHSGAWHHCPWNTSNK